MAVPKRRKTRSKRGMHRSHDSTKTPALSVDYLTGETHRRHNITADGYYRGRQIITPKELFKEGEEEQAKAAVESKVAATTEVSE